MFEGGIGWGLGFRSQCSGFRDPLLIRVSISWNPKLAIANSQSQLSQQPWDMDRLPAWRARHTHILLLCKHPTTIQASYYCTSILLLYMHLITIQASYYNASTLLLNKHPTIQYKHPTTIQASCYYTRILLLYKHPTTIQASFY